MLVIYSNSVRSIGMEFKASYVQTTNEDERMLFAKR